jgi:hypothetical protein
VSVCASVFGHGPGGRSLSRRPGRQRSQSSITKKSLFVTAGTYKLCRLAILASSKSDGSLSANERVMT